jgi:hypothetical protein
MRSSPGIRPGCKIQETPNAASGVENSANSFQQNCVVKAPQCEQLNAVSASDGSTVLLIGCSVLIRDNKRQHFERSRRVTYHSLKSPLFVRFDHIASVIVNAITASCEPL